MATEEQTERKQQETIIPPWGISHAVLSYNESSVAWDVVKTNALKAVREWTNSWATGALVTIRPGGLGTAAGSQNLCRPLPAGGTDVTPLSRTSQTSILSLITNHLLFIPVLLFC